MIAFVLMKDASSLIRLGFMHFLFLGFYMLFVFWLIHLKICFECVHGYESLLPVWISKLMI